MAKKATKRDRLRLVTHPRSGTHWVLRTIFANFATPYTNYLQMLGGHKFEADIREKFSRAHIMHCSRHVQPVVMSVFRMRERNGIKLNDFSEFIRTPYRQMPRVIGKCKILLDDKMTVQPRKSWIQEQRATPPQLWLLTNMFWMAYADWTITYEQMQDDQESVLAEIGRRLGWKRKKQQVITKTVGWHPPNNEPFEVSSEDSEYLAEFSRMLEEYKKRCGYGDI